MTSEIEVVEERLKSFLVQLQAECGILERITYKNKNQHRRSSYFQYLLKVRRDQKLLNSIHLEELLESCFHVINGRKAKQKVHLLESLKRRKCEAGKYNFLERLLGAARLLSQMTEPILKAATEISTLLARSFFMGFSLTILSLLARLRVLVQQLLLDVVVVFNEVSSLSQRKQSIKITQDGVDVFREYYPTMEEFLTLECVWKIDKFVLVEKCSMKRQEYGNQEVIDPPGTPAIQYQSIEAFLGEDELVSKKANADSDTEENPSFIEEKQTLASPLTEADHSKVVEDPLMPQADSGLVVPPSKSLDLVGCSPSTGSSSSLLKSKTVSRGRGVAFISVKKPAPPAAGAAELGNYETESKRDD
ncbi:hypothetical protein Nepgr_014918 [Nepenthes gracilis]|uniref:Nucleolus and neural progenitor protein-like N-terminal domain-containing protein n=1 Tax=Nepenthes gracilis TaxID=150966 RepID=A0AAD3XPY4_NEPGR|nr:hypothetical protein Nepgr_014918 [Nepenthes gracilis]